MKLRRLLAAAAVVGMLATSASAFGGREAASCDQQYAEAMDAADASYASCSNAPSGINWPGTCYAGWLVDSAAAVAAYSACEWSPKAAGG